MPKASQDDIAKCENPEFARWLWQWYKEAQEKDGRVQFALRKAFDAVVGHREKLKNGREAVKLTGIGPGISERLEKRLRQHVAEGNQWHYSMDPQGGVGEEPGRKRPRKSKPIKKYIPPFRSAPYAIIMALAAASPDEFCSVDRLLTSTNPYSGAILNESVVGRALKGLVEKGLADQLGIQKRYSLSAEGRELARLLKDGKENAGSVADSVVSVRDDFAGTHSKNGQQVLDHWPIDKYSVELIVDLREVRSKTERDSFVAGVEQKGIPVCQKCLDLGDMLFIARNRETGEEAVLDIIIERKTDADLVHSITDGRFKEQKHRLKKCGVRNVIYLIEGTGDGPAVRNFGEEKYYAAVAQITFTDNFFVKRCMSMEDTFQFLHDAFVQVQGRFACGLNVLIDCGEPSIQAYSNTLSTSSDLLMTYSAYCLLNSKSGHLTFKDIYLQQLMCIRGMSAEKAKKFAERYGSFSDLFEMYDALGSEQSRQNEFSNFAGPNGKRFGPALSHCIYDQLYKNQ